MLLDELVKNRSLLVLLSAINAVKDGYFGAVFIIIQRILKCFGRRNGDLLKKSHIGH